MVTKRVLFIHIDFYEYNYRIIDKMHELGYDVDSFCEDAGINFFEKLICKVNSKYIISKSLRMQGDLIRSMRSQQIQYDLIFVIKGERLSRKFLSELRRINPNARIILYLWDDVARVTNFFDNRECYDKILSFDKHDAMEYGLSFLPLFFCDEFRIKSSDKKSLDIYFSGWEHSNRRELIETMLPVFNDMKMKVYIHLYTGRWKTFKDKAKQLSFKKTPVYIKYNKLTMQENAKLTTSSRVIIDIQHPTQKGLSMRTMETLSAKAKLITTNGDIKNYDFYNPQNILIVDREKPVIDRRFLTTPYEDISDEIVEKYSLTNWVKAVLENINGVKI